VVDQNDPMQSFVQHYGYFALFLLAMLESMCVPIPSEVTFGFAGALCTTAVATGTPLSLPIVIVIGVLGEVVGALIAYAVGRTLGRTIVDRWGKWILLSHRDLDSAERWFGRYGVYSVLIGRVIPVVRSVISVPAGVAEMNVPIFAGLTALGSAIWISLIASLGYAAGSNWRHVERYFHDAQYPVIAIVVLVIGFGLLHRWRAVRAANESAH
jgi:membrane protein DedA with SNARE-associated domain